MCLHIVEWELMVIEIDYSARSTETQLITFSEVRNRSLSSPGGWKIFRSRRADMCECGENIAERTYSKGLLNMTLSFRASQVVDLDNEKDV